MNEPISIVYWLYPDPDGYRRYTVEHVNAQLPMLKKHCDVPYRVVCVTDHADGLDPSINVIPDPIRTDGPVDKTHRYPPCMRKLWNFSKEACVLGKRIWSLDIDGLFCRNVRPLLEREEDLVVWRNTAGKIMGGAYLLTTGTHQHVWNLYDPVESPRVLRSIGFQQSDQGWLNYTLPRSTPSWRDGLHEARTYKPDLPATARLVSFVGDSKPWMPAAQQRYPWIKQHYEVANA